jgi:hypothetical protein
MNQQHPIRWAAYVKRGASMEMSVGGGAADLLDTIAVFLDNLVIGARRTRIEAEYS